LNKLNISKNEITTNGMSRLKESLKTTIIVELDISQNPLGNSGIKELSNYLFHDNCIIDRLDISDCKFTWEGGLMLMTSVKHMKRLVMDRNNLKSHTRNNHFQQIM
jgi:Ran GTPase-activating protein (RanGAP) involved in mRNA processing and transport